MTEGRPSAVGTVFAVFQHMRTFGPTLETAVRGLDVRMQRHHVLASNVANQDTPQFVPLDVDVAAVMAEPKRGANVLSVTQSGHLTTEVHPVDALPPPQEAPSQKGGLDGNRVDVDQAMTNLAQNALEYAATSRGMARQLALLRYAASDGTA